MDNAHFIAGDWGTSHLRLFLCNQDGHVLDQAAGPGAAAARGRFAEIFTHAIAPWSEHGPLPALLCGMVGSRQGWKEAPYLPCPASLEQLAGASVEAGLSGVRILPGLSCTNPLDATDFLRGEETQVLGALMLDPRLRHGRHLLVLPGTHSKWLQLADARVQHFQTVVTGEVYAALRGHSVLVASAAAADDDAPLNGAFLLGLVRARTSSPDSLLAQLFECRARRLAGELPPGQESEFLSGLLIGHELNHGLRHAAARRTRICLVGATALTRRYAYALSVFGIDADCMAGDQAARAGLAAACRSLVAEEC